MAFFKFLPKLISYVLLIALISIIAVISLVYYGFRIEPGFIAVNRISVRIKNLPNELEGLKIVQVSDLHGKEFSEDKLIKKLNDLKPDIVAITGDTLDNSIIDYDYIVRTLRPVQSKFGKFFVYGNNEFGRKLSRTEMDRAYSKAEVTVLNNSNYRINYKGQHLWLIGVDDPNTNHDSLDKALKGTDKGPKILLSHSPEIISQASKADIDLVLAGHTHGGQIKIPGLSQHQELQTWLNRILSKAARLYNRGMEYVHKQPSTVKLPQAELMFSFNMKPGYEVYISGMFKVANTLMYVNRGLGETWVDMRLFSPPEITVFELTVE